MKKLLFLSLVVLLFNCKGNKQQNKIKLPGKNNIKEMVRKENPSPYILVPANAKDFIITDSIIKGLPYLSEERFIPLDFKNGPIGRISKILFNKNRIFILDNSRNNESIFVYDTLGNSIKKIADIGKGPKEFFGLGDVDIDTFKNELVLDDRLSHRKLFYNMDGNYLRTERTRINSRNFAFIGDKTAYLSSFDQNWLIDELMEYPFYAGKKDTILFKGFRFRPFEKGDISNAEYGLRKNYRGELLYNPTCSDTIFKILSDSTFTVAAYFKFIKPMYQKLLRFEKENLEPVSMLSKQGYMRFFNNLYLEVNNCIFYECLNTSGKTGEVSFYIYDKERKVSYKMKGIGYFGLPLRKVYCSPIGIYKNWFVGVYEAYNLKEIVKRGNIRVLSKDSTTTIIKFRIGNPYLAEIIENTIEHGNPILLLYRFNFK